MKKILSLFVLITLNLSSYSQSKTINKEIASYSYPLYIKLKDGKIANATCFFVMINKRSCLITAAHVLMNLDTQKKYDIERLSVFLNPENKNELGFEFNLKGKQVLYSKLENNEYVDLVAVPLIINEKKIKFVPLKKEIDLLDTPIKGNVFITGYPNKKLKVIQTKISNWQKKVYFFYTENSSNYGASGAPVFNIQNGNIELVGIYTGRNPILNQGTVTKAGLLISLLRRNRNKIN